MDVGAVLGLAPDARVASGATRLAAATGWSGLGRSGAALWGSCPGGGDAVHTVCVILADRSAHCSCPSRKAPCKHALALLLRHARSPLPVADEPERVRDRLARRATGPAARDASPEAERRRGLARERTAAKRREAVAAGVAGLSDWLADVAAAGLAALPGRDAAWWRSAAARLVDAKAPGLASAVAEVQGIVAAAGPAWPQDAADRLGGLHLLTRLAETSQEPLAAVVRARLGFTVPEERVLAEPGWTDHWAALLRSEHDDGRVRTVRQWVWGRWRREWVVAVRHAGGGTAPEPALPHGTQSFGELHPYPGVPPRRVAVGELRGRREPEPIAAPGTWREALAALEPLVVADPWQRLQPVGCARVRFTADARHLADAERLVLPVRDDRALDRALAVTGGAEFDAWGLWDGTSVRLGAVAAPGGAPEVVG
jgi:hypothetical protein